MQRVLSDFGADHAFAQAAQKVQEHYGVSVPVNRTRGVCLHHAEVLAQRLPEPVRTLGAGGPDHIVAEADGTMVPVVETTQAPAGADRRKHRQVRWQEARLVAARALGKATTYYGATLGEVTETGVRWSQTVGKAGWGTHSRIHGVGDGATWIAQQCNIQFGERGSYLLDLFHVCEYLAAAAPQPSQSKAWVHTQKQALVENRSSEVLAELKQRLEPVACPEENAPVRKAFRYLENRSHQLDYAGAKAHHLPVGSGLIESGHRHVIQARLKKAGAWWNPTNAHAMLQLRTCRANGDWDRYWNN